MDPKSAMQKSLMLEEVVEIINEICWQDLLTQNLRSTTRYGDLFCYSSKITKVISYKMAEFSEGDHFQVINAKAIEYEFLQLEHIY